MQSQQYLPLNILPSCLGRVFGFYKPLVSGAITPAKRNYSGKGLPGKTAPDLPSVVSTFCAALFRFWTGAAEGAGRWVCVVLRGESCCFFLMD